jgi:D-sedoheptulose 7-phosphate isomerase
MEPVQNYIAAMQQILERLPYELIDEVIAILQSARLKGRQIFIMGNGGSASTASHFVADLAKNTRNTGWPSFKAIGLTDNLAILTAYANDEGYENVFAQQLANLIQPDDVVIAFSTSGNSQNVLKAVEFANQVKARTIGFTGFDGGKLGPLVDVHVHVPCNIIEQVEDVHLILEHIIVKTLREITQQSHPKEQPMVISGSIFEQAIQQSIESYGMELAPSQREDMEALLEESYTPETKERIKSSLELLYRISNEIEPGMELRDILHRVLELTMDGIGASSGSFIITNEKGDIAEAALAYQGKVDFNTSHALGEIAERGLAGWVLENRKSALIASTSDDPRWLPGAWENHAKSSRSAVSVPLMDKDHVVGVLTLVHSEAGKFTREDLVLLTAIAVYISFHSAKSFVRFRSAKS